MATPTLTGLPTELLVDIIPHVLPEGFESLALTCKTIYELCTPFLERHNCLRSRFQDFQYTDFPRDQPLIPIRSAFELISRIAIEPAVAHYIKHADLDRDTFPPRVRIPGPVPDVNFVGPVISLFANSPYLKQAGLDWKEYYAQTVEEIGDVSLCYSQHAAAFLLTLLPNVKALRLPKLWKSLEKTERLLDVVVCESRDSHSPSDRPGLAQVSTFEVPTWGHQFGLHKAFHALPHVRLFRSRKCAARDDVSTTFAWKGPYLRYGETLEIANLTWCCLDEVAIADFLKHTPRLRTLKYSHLTPWGSDPRDWDICKFATAIEREAGSCLEELSVSIHELRGSIIPGKASLGGFQRLRKLQFPLEIAMCNLTDATTRASTPNEGFMGQEPGRFESFICDLVPASACQLSLLSSGKDHHEKALEIMFRDLAVKKDFHLPALKEIYLSYDKRGCTEEFKEECAKLAANTEEAGVVLHLQDWNFVSELEWEGQHDHVFP